MTAKRHFAVGLKGWVQIRVAAKTPKLITSQASVTVSEKRATWVADGKGLYSGRYVVEKIPKKLVLESKVYEGGRTVATVQQSTFNKRLKVRIREGTLLELSPEQVAQLKLEKSKLT